MTATQQQQHDHPPSFGGFVWVQSAQDTPSPLDSWTIVSSNGSPKQLLSISSASSSHYLRNPSTSPRHYTPEPVLLEQPRAYPSTDLTTDSNDAGHSSRVRSTTTASFNSMYEDPTSCELAQGFEGHMPVLASTRQYCWDPQWTNQFQSSQLSVGGPPMSMLQQIPFTSPGDFWPGQYLGPQVFFRETAIGMNPFSADLHQPLEQDMFTMGNDMGIFSTPPNGCNYHDISSAATQSDGGRQVRNTASEATTEPPLGFVYGESDPWNALHLAQDNINVQGHCMSNDGKRLHRNYVTAQRNLHVPIAPKPDGRTSVAPQRSDNKITKTGKRKGPLLHPTRENAKITRDKKACWPCVFLKMTCKGDGFCDKCSLRRHRGQSHLLGCLRIRLTDMVTTILPSSMTKMHQHDDLITYVQERAIGWLDERPDIWVDLNTGFGPSFRWLLHEYEPAWPELLYREQQELCADGLTWRLTKKRSPPLGVKKLDKGDDKRLKDYISTLVSYHLNDFEKACFDGEDPFKIKVTGLLCTLYRRLRYDSQHGALRDALTSIFKMLAATLIMDHTIDIDDAGRDQTLTRLSGHNDPAAYSQRVSPWMASMQLKYYFARIRHDHYNDILGRLQQILHNPVKMYPRICALILILALGLVLEECQQLLLFQAEGRLSRGEEKDEWVARNKARQQCAEIDGAFSHIKNIFHCRYATGRNTQQADIRTWLNSSKDPWEKGFLRSLIDLCDEHRDHLKNRESLDLGSASNDNHSSRLLARFLLSVT